MAKKKEDDTLFGAKILKHPDKEDIVRMLTNGESIRKVAAYLKKSYPRSPNLWISEPTLQQFRKKHLNLDGQVLKDIQETTKEEKQKIREQLHNSQIQSTSAYKDKLNQIVDKRLDVANKIVQMDSIVSDRIEHWYNLIKSGEEVPSKADQELRKFVQQQMEILTSYKKLIEGMADKRVDYNINVNILNDQITIMRDAIKEVIAEELGTERAVLFMDKLHKRLKKTAYTYVEPDAVEVVNLEELKALGATSGN